MKALRFDHTGELDALHLADRPLPEPGPGEVLVRVTAAGLNPSDVKNVLGRFPYTVLPRTPGRDFAGVVEKGPAEQIGREVWGTGNELGFLRDGSHAEYMTLPADGVAPRPRSLTFAQCAACGVPYTTALDALDRTSVTKGTHVLVIGAGAVGQAAIDIARCRGARVVAAVRRAGQVDALRRAGVAAVSLAEPADLPSAARLDETAPEVVFDTTGQWLEPAVHALGRFGRLAVIAAPQGDHARLPVLVLYRKGGSIVGINSLLYDTRACAKMLARLGAAFDEGSLRAPSPPAEVPLDAALGAYREVNGGRSDKIVFITGAPA